MTVNVQIRKNITSAHIDFPLYIKYRSKRAHNFGAYVWRPLMNMLNIKYRTFEQTRHTYASILLVEGERPYYISKQMGHASLYTTLTRYAKFIPNDDDGNVLSKVTEKLQR